MREVMLITGASRGIGAASAVLAAERGYDVAISYRRDSDAAESVAEQVRARGARTVSIQADIANEDDVERMFATVDSVLGTLAVLVNNAGTLDRQMRLEEMSAERFERTLRVNVIGVFLCCRAAVRRMSTRYGGTGGRIVNVSSAAARMGSAREYVDYAASKGAVDTMTIGLANEVAGEGIRVNAVRPGIVYTELHALGGEPGRVDRVKAAVPMKRGGQPAEIAHSILWLASNESSYCTGSFVDASGGR
ncbi:MAG: SDR family oxidoreductase [Gammaproteobacteria bacterium]|nr:SDR family oxidoreductase [Gammaproteobacteria bacterium]